MPSPKHKGSHFMSIFTIASCEKYASILLKNDAVDQAWWCAPINPELRRQNRYISVSSRLVLST